MQPQKNKKTNDRAKRILFLISAIVVCLTGVISPADARAVERENIKVGFFRFDGYHEINDAGERSGYGYDLLQMLRPYTNWNCQYVGYEDGWTHMLPMLKDNRIDLLSSTVKTPEKLKYFDFSAQPVGYSSVLMTVRAGESKYHEEDYANWNGIRVGMLRDNSKNAVFAAFAKRMNFTFVQKDFDSVEALAEALRNNTIDAIVTGSLRRIHDEWIYEQLDIQPFYFMVRKGNKRLLAELDSAIDHLYSTTPDFIERLHRKYYSISYDEGKINFSRQEREFIQKFKQKNTPLPVLVNPDRYPLSYFDQKGKFKGVMSEILELVAKRTGLKFIPIRCADRKEYRQALITHRAPIVIDMSGNPDKAERLGYLLGNGYFPATVSRLICKDFAGNPQKMAIVRSSNMAAAVREHFADTPLQLTEYDSIAEVVDAVRSGQQDAGFLFTRSAEAAILNDRSGTLALDPAGIAVNFSFGISENAPRELYSILARATANISSDEIQRFLLAANLRLHRPFNLQDLVAGNPTAVFFSLLGLIVVLGGALATVLIAKAKIARAAATLEKNSRMWRILIDSLPIHIFAKDGNDHFRYIFSNNARAEFYRYRFAKIEGFTDSELFEEPFAMARLSEDNGDIQDDTIHERTFDLPDKDGKIHHLRTLQRSFIDPDGTRLLLACSIDLTELIETRKTAEHNAELFHKTLISIGDGVMTTDARGAVTLLNPVAEKMLACKQAEVIGRPHEDIFKIVRYPDNAPVQSPVNRALSEGVIVALANHTDLIAADGKRYHIADSAAPIRDEHGNIQGAILVFRDVTMEYNLRDKLEASAVQLRQALEQAQSASSAKGVFLSQMSHEIRTPLNAIIGYLTIAKDEDDKREKVDECLEKGLVASRHLLAIINDILDISSIESGKMKIADDDFDFKHLLTGIVAMFYNQAEAKNIRFEVSLSELSEEWLVGDSLRVNQILMNLLSNAMKFTPNGGAITLKVKQLGYIQKRIQIRFEVTDSGCGMSKEFMSRLFTAFEQQDSSTARKFGGNGLGMSITKNLVTMMGGTIEVQSEENVGTTFTVLLPFGKSTRENPAGEGDFSKLRALIVDDSEDDRIYLQQVLKKCGVKSDAVDSGETALEQLERRMESRHPYDLCLVDLRLTGMDGIETARRMRELQKNPDLPIILVTAYDTSAIAAAAHEAGVNKVIAKPLFQSTFFDFLMNTYYERESRNVKQQVSASLKDLRVMLVEDNQMNMDIATQFLTKAGLVVTQAWNGKEALERFNASKPGEIQAILMDIQMPVMDGYEATRAIRSGSHPEAKTIPIIAMTANAFNEDVTRALQAGMNDHVSKPIAYDQLFAALSKLTVPANPYQSRADDDSK